jgi:hypothetical protein
MASSAALITFWQLLYSATSAGIVCNAWRSSAAVYVRVSWPCS